MEIPPEAGASPLAAAIVSTSDLAVAASAIHGTGVFAARPFDEGEQIERCPILLCPAPDEAHLQETGLWGFYFDWEDGDVAVALGYGSLYNHAWHANARYEQDHDLEVVDFVAVRRIEAGEEVTINYNGDPDGIGELWFTPSEGQPPG